MSASDHESFSAEPQIDPADAGTGAPRPRRRRAPAPPAEAASAALVEDKATPPKPRRQREAGAAATNAPPLAAVLPTSAAGDGRDIAVATPAPEDDGATHTAPAAPPNEALGIDPTDMREPPASRDEARPAVADPIEAVSALPKRRGRPPRRVEAQSPTPAPTAAVPPPDQPASHGAARTAMAEPVEAAPAPPKRRGRPPRRVEAAPPSPEPAATVPAPVAPPPAKRSAAAAMVPAPRGVIPDDPAFHQLVRLWHELHPQARRALVIHAAMLRAEGDAGT